MKKAVIATGGKQYLVSEGDVINVEFLDSEKVANFTPLLVIEDETVSIGTPEVAGAKVEAEIIEQEIRGEKVTAIRYKAKKRVRKVRGHRQLYSQIKVKKITQKNKTSSKSK